MNKMIRELEEKLRMAKSQKKDWEAKEKFWTEAVKTAKTELTILEEDIGNLEMMIEAAKEMHHNYGDAKPEKTPAVKTEKAKEVEIEPRHKGAMVLQLNQYDNVTNRWKTQSAASKELKWDQSSISKFMKLSKESQIQKKGFALVWQY